MALNSSLHFYVQERRVTLALLLTGNTDIMERAEKSASRYDIELCSTYIDQVSMKRKISDPSVDLIALAQKATQDFQRVYREAIQESEKCFSYLIDFYKKNKLSKKKAKVAYIALDQPMSMTAIKRRFDQFHDIVKRHANSLVDDNLKIVMLRPIQEDLEMALKFANEAIAALFNQIKDFIKVRDDNHKRIIDRVRLILSAGGVAGTAAVGGVPLAG